MSTKASVCSEFRVLGFGSTGFEVELLLIGGLQGKQSGKQVHIPNGNCPL